VAFSIQPLQFPDLNFLELLGEALKWGISLGDVTTECFDVGK